jgi:hypothetical protein
LRLTEVTGNPAGDVLAGRTEAIVSLRSRRRQLAATSPSAPLKIATTGDRGEAPASERSTWLVATPKMSLL